MEKTKAASMTAEIDLLEGLVAASPDGISRPELEAAFRAARGYALTWRTLLRRTQVLVAQGRIVPRRVGRSTVYVPGPAFIPEAPPPEEGYIPISREGAQVRALVRRPFLERKPVGYKPGFLERYRPGKTWYLPRDLRERLHQMGRTPDAERPAGTYAREIFNRLLIDLAWASSKLEGNTYSRLDTLNLLEFGQVAEGKDATDAQMILNHKAAIELLVDPAGNASFNLYTFTNLHAALSENLLSDPADEGRLRTRIVEIAGSTYHPPAIPQQVEDWFRLMLLKADAIADPFEQAFFTMVHLPYLQPFVDVNKRTSRLGANLPFIRENLCPLSFVDVPERAYVDATLGVYELTRIELLRDVFVWAYERSCAQYRVVREAVGQPDPLRLRYRAELASAVRDMVLAGEPPRTELLTAWAASHAIAAADVAGFAERALLLLVNLHEGSLHRYGLRPSEFTEWRARFPPPDGTSRGIPN